VTGPITEENGIEEKKRGGRGRERKAERKEMRKKEL
jgi:hypothetical protein